MPIFLQDIFEKNDDRCEIFAKYIIDNGSTVRDTAAHFGISKSTVHKDVTEKLYRKNPTLYGAAREVLERNKSERHLRGGNATKLRYKNLRNRKNKQQNFLTEVKI